MPERWQQFIPEYIDPWLSSYRIRSLSDAAYRAVHTLFMVEFQQPDGMLPENEVILARMAGKESTWAAIREEVLQFFEPGGSGRIYNARCHAEWLRAKNLYEQRVAAGQATAKKRWSKDSTAIAEQVAVLQREKKHSDSIVPIPIPIPIPIPKAKANTKASANTFARSNEKTVARGPAEKSNPNDGAALVNTSEPVCGDEPKAVPGDCQPSKPAVGAASITLPLADGSEWAISPKVYAELVSAYPLVEAPQELRAMRAWLIANQRNRKTKRGILRFVNFWLSRAQTQASGRDHGETHQQPESAAVARLRRSQAAIRAAFSDIADDDRSGNQATDCPALFADDGELVGAGDCAGDGANVPPRLGGAGR